MPTPAPNYCGGDRFEIAETRVNVPPEMQCLQTADAALSDFAARYLALPTSAAVLLQRFLSTL